MKTRQIALAIALTAISVPLLPTQALARGDRDGDRHPPHHVDDRGGRHAPGRDHDRGRRPEPRFSDRDRHHRDWDHRDRRHGHHDHHYYPVVRDHHDHHDHWRPWPLPGLTVIFRD